MSELLPAAYLRRYFGVYPTAKSQAEYFRAAKGQQLGDWPDWCYLPLSGAYAITAYEAERQGVEKTLMASDVGNLGALLAWRQTQGVYRFDKTLFRALWETDLSGDIPTSTLYSIPEWCVWIETPGITDPIESRGFFAYLEHDMNTGRAELRLFLDSTQSQYPPGALIQQILHLNQPTIAEALAAGYREGERQARKAGEPMSDLPAEAMRAISAAFAKIVAPRLSLLLYLCTVNSEIRDAKGSTKAPANPGPVKTRHGAKLFAAATPTKWDVGFRIGAALKRAQEQAEAEERTATGTHASPRPHIRRAHWHTYKTGPGRTNELLKWLPPIPVNVELPDDLIPTIRPVR